MPNPNTIPYYRYQDIRISDVSLRTQFLTYVGQGNYSAALNLLESNEDQLAGKAYVAEAIQLIADGISSLETSYFNNTTVFLNNLLSQYTALINNLIRRGTWNSSIQYYVNNFVVYNQEIYYCFSEPPVGTLPTDTNYWLYVGLRGPQGAPGIDVNMRYTYNASTAYAVNDLVVYENNIYVAIQPSTGVLPTNEQYWLLFLQVNKGEIYVGMNPPTTYTNNSVWFQTYVDPSTHADTSTISGIFKRYSETEGIWEEMYPGTLFTLIQGRDEYRDESTEIATTILSSDWSNSTWTYMNDVILADSIVRVMTQGGLTDEQKNIYNYLTITTSTGSFTLTAREAPTVDLPIRIIIS